MSPLTLAGAMVGTFPIGMRNVDGIVRSAGTIHDFVVFLASRVATKGSCISRLEIFGLMKVKSYLT